MPSVTVVARPGKVVTDNVVITFHAVMDETHNLSNTITDHPVEEGFNISDHSRPNPDQVTFNAVISNTPLSEGQVTQAVRSGGFTFQTTADQAAGAIGATDGFAQGEWLKLRALRDNGTLVKVVSTLGDYDSMAIETISIPRNAKKYDAVYFTIGFKKVRVVQNKLTRNIKSTDKRVGKKKHAGAKTTSDATQKDVDPLRKVKDGVKDAGNKVLSGFGGT